MLATQLDVCDMRIVLTLQPGVASNPRFPSTNQRFSTGITMNSTVPTFLRNLDVGEPTACANLTMVPLFHKLNAQPDYITLEEGLASDLLEVEELEGGASVNDILFRNKSDHFALLFEGEEFLGAKQNRILNVSILVRAKSKQTLPVSCVEAGRWQHEHDETEQQKFSVADRMHYARGRAMENSAVSRNLESDNAFRGDQQSVWEDIERKSQRLSANSPTSASDVMYVSKKSSLEDYVKSFGHAPNQVGSVFLVNDKVAGLEIYASDTTHKQMLQRLIRSYALDAIDSENERIGRSGKPKDSKPEGVRQEANAFVKQLENSWVKQFDGLCLGQNIRFRDDGVTGGALVHDERVLHLCAFATER